MAAGMKIFLRPGDELASFVPCSAVATGRSTTDRAHKLAIGFPTLSYLGAERVNAKHKKPSEGVTEHTLRLANEANTLPR